MYDPTDVDLVWMANVLEITNEGALMVFPNTGLIYKVSHLNKSLTLQNPSKLADPTCQQLHEMTAVVASFFMYSVKEATQ